MAKTLIPMIEERPHLTYAEPFYGQGGVFLRRRLRPKAEVVNDLSKDVATFLRILQRHYTAFMDMLRFQVTSRAEFNRLLSVDPDTLTDLERAARFLVLQRMVFGGQPTSRSFGYSKHSPGRFDVTKLQPVLADIHERIAGVIIECLTFEAFIRRYDAPDTLFMLDPPYWGCEDDYGQGMFSRADFEVLRSLLDGLQGRFILTINDRPETRALFAGFTLQPVSLTYHRSGKPTEGRELIVTGR